MDHVRDHDGNVVDWYLSRLSAEAFQGGDPELLDRLERGTRLVRGGVAGWRAAAGLPPVSPRRDPHQGHDVRPDAQGVDVCWTCSSEEVTP